MKLLTNLQLQEKLDEEPPKFCPFCREIFLFGNGYEHIKSKQKFSYSCSFCKALMNFTHNDYKNEANNGKKYHTSQVNSIKRVNKFITDEVEALAQEGFSHREIHQITHFSRARINSILQLEQEKATISLKKFFIEHLMIDNEITKKLLKKELIEKEAKVPLIDKALEYGCSIDFTSKIFYVRKSTVVTRKKYLPTLKKKEKRFISTILDANNRVIINKKSYSAKEID